MAYKKFALYFKRIDQIIYEIIANLFTHSFLSAFLLILIPLILSGQIIKRTAYTKIQITVTFLLLILKKSLQKKNCLYI